MKKLPLFVTATVLGGIGGFIGSVAGSGYSRGALFAGGFVGGVVMAPLTAWVAKWRRWIDPSRFWPVAIGAALGFVAAATIAVNTLSSPVGPMVAATLTGLGALAGGRSRAS
jgi:fructose-specific phosphotransferase system IIC component